MKKPPQFEGLILRERLPDGFNRKTGWVIVGEEAGVRERSLLAVLSYEIGLDLARELTQLLGQKYQVKRLVEELADSERHDLVEMTPYPYFLHQPPQFLFEH